jgi:hypothetical protein
MAVLRLHKREIAQKQLETALCLDSEGRDPLSVITLAGAAEEILGKLLACDGRPNALQVRHEMAEQFFPSTEPSVTRKAFRAGSSSWPCSSVSWRKRIRCGRSAAG